MLFQYLPRYQFRESAYGTVCFQFPWVSFWLTNGCRNSNVLRWLGTLLGKSLCFPILKKAYSLTWDLILQQKHFYKKKRFSYSCSRPCVLLHNLYRLTFLDADGYDLFSWSCLALSHFWLSVERWKSEKGREWHTASLSGFHLIDHVLDYSKHIIVFDPLDNLWQ